MQPLCNMTDYLVLITPMMLKKGDHIWTGHPEARTALFSRVDVSSYPHRDPLTRG
jgi:hypothetical protein